MLMTELDCCADNRGAAAKNATAKITMTAGRVRPIFMEAPEKILNGNQKRALARAVKAGCFVQRLRYRNGEGKSNPRLPKCCRRVFLKGEIGRASCRERV